jgi:hypothetical protein
VNDFSSPAKYTVTAQDGSTKNYTVTVVAPPAFSGVQALNVQSSCCGPNYSLTLPLGIDLTNVNYYLSWYGASIVPDPSTVHDFSAPVSFTATGTDGTTAQTTVTITTGADSPSLTSVTVAGVPGTQPYGPGSTTVWIWVPPGTDTTSLVPTYVFTGASISPPVGSAVNFQWGVGIFPSAADGSSKYYNVNAGYHIGGTYSGPTSGLQLGFLAPPSPNPADPPSYYELIYPSSSTFDFGHPFGTTYSYDLVVAVPPTGTTSCTVTNGVGVVATADVTNIAVSCQ